MSTFRKVFALLTPRERKSALALVALMLIGMALEILGVGIVMPVIAVLSRADIAANYPRLRPLLAALGNPTQAQLLTAALLSLVAIYVVKAAFLAFLAWRQNKFAADVRLQLSRRLFTVYLRQPYTFHLQRNSAQLMRNVTGEVGMFGSVLTHSMTLLTEGLVLLGLGGLLLVVAPLSAMIVVLVLFAAGAGFHFGTRGRVSRWGVERQYHEGRRAQHLAQGLAGAKDVKLLGREQDFLDQYEIHNSRSVRITQMQGTLTQLPRLWLELFAVVGLSGISLAMVAQGRDMSTIMPILGIFGVAAFRLMPSVNRLLGAVQYLPYGRPAIDSIYEEFQLPVPDPAAARGPARPFTSRVNLVDVTYAYAGAASAALRGVTLGVKKGEYVGFVGPTGSGKSTLVDIVLGLLTPDSGKVLVDGEDITCNLRRWQDQIGYVPQSIYLTDDTVRRNVAFGLADEEIDDAAVRRSISAAQLDGFIAALPAGLETIVGERGVRLSGGERQRIGIARALYHDPGVLVLDEATSALDVGTEADLMRAVNALRGKTILVVAHRISAVERCNRLYRMHGGRIVAEGAPSEILHAVRGSAEPDEETTAP